MKKNCIYCGKQFVRSEFNKRHKYCSRNCRSRDWNIKHIERHRVQDKEYQKRKRRKYPERKMQEAKNYRKRYPERKKVHLILYRAIQSGKIKKQVCEVCNNGNSQGHHEDYSKPLEVIWLCPSCHQKLHLVKRILLLG